MSVRFAARKLTATSGATPVEGALEAVLRETGLDLAGARARLGFARGHLLEVVVLSAAFPSGTDDAALDAAGLLVARLIGDARFEDWIGAVEVAPAPRPGSLRVLADGGRAPSSPPSLSLAEVEPAVTAAIRGLEAELPAVPYHALRGRAGWTLLEAEPAPAEDYPLQDDLVLMSTLLPEAMKCFLQGAPFSSCRFSRHEERIFYVKVDGESRDVDARFALRVKLEEALDRALVPGGLGCVVGAGLGLRYVYVVLALARVDAALETASAALRVEGVGRRSWVLPCDTRWAKDFVPVYPDGPRPP